MRTIWITAEAWPFSEATIAASHAAGCAEIMNTDDQALAGLGVSLGGGDRAVTVAEPGDPPADLAGAQAFRIAALQGFRAAAVLAFSYAGQQVPLTDTTQNDIGNAVAALQQLPAGTTIQWEIVDGVYVTMDLAALQAMGLAAFNHVQACFANSATITAAINAAASAEAVYAVDLTTGWPA